MAKRTTIRISKEWRMAMQRCGLNRHEMARVAISAKAEGVSGADGQGVIHLAKTFGLTKAQPAFNPRKQRGY